MCREGHACVTDEREWDSALLVLEESLVHVQPFPSRCTAGRLCSEGGAEPSACLVGAEPCAGAR